MIVKEDGAVLVMEIEGLLLWSKKEMKGERIHRVYYSNKNGGHLHTLQKVFFVKSIVVILYLF